MTLHRKRRVAADEAHSWARNLRLGNPLGKLVLSMTTLYVNGEGSCFVSVEQLAEDCELAQNTIRSRLAWLESITAIARFPQWVDEHGRRNGEGRGRRTTDEIRLLLNADSDEIEARASGQALEAVGNASENSPARDEGSAIDRDPACGEGLNGPSPAPALHQPSNCAQGLISEPEPEEQEPTPNPLPAEGGVRSETPSEKKEPDRLNIFAEVYPIPITDYGKAATMWAGLSEAERTEAITGAKGYATFVKSNPKRAAQDAHRWLRDRKWLGYLNAGRQAESLDARCDVFEGSEQWRAWEIFYRCCYAAMPSFLITGPQGEQKFNAPREWPPVGRGLNPDKSTWKTFHEGSGQFSAWLRRLHEIPNIAIGTPSVHVGGKYIRSITVPCEWPPRKDGTAPPGELTDEDAEEFLKRA